MRFLSAAALALTLLVPSGRAEPPFSREAYLSDLGQIKRLIAERAPNLAWSIDARGLDLPELAETAQSAVAKATDAATAREALRDFVGAFGDGHMALLWPDEDAQDDQVWGTASLCRSLGYADEERPEGLALARAGARAVNTPDSEVFPIHVLDLPGGRLGVLRLPSFHEWGFYRYCPQAVAEIGPPEDGECGEDCGAAIGRRAADLLTAAVARQIAALKAQNVAALAIDITQNGGGSLWLDPVARMLTPVKLKAPRLAVTRTAIWREALARQLATVEADLANPLVGLGYRNVLTTAQATLKAALSDVEATCDRHMIWQGRRPDCDLVAPARLYATGVLDYAEPGEFSLLQSSGALFSSTYYTYEEALWRGPLYVLIDEGSASAAEHFAAMLRDNGAATLIGEPTFGAGCGWMAGGDEPVTLAHTGVKFHIPDCVWLRRDGSNEVAGIEPDIVVPWRWYDNGYQRAVRAVAVLKTLSHPQPAAAGPAVSGSP